MKIGIAANQGSNAEISEVPFADSKYMLIIMLFFLFIIVVLIVYFTISIIRKRKNKNVKMDENIDISDDVISLKDTKKNKFKLCNFFKRKNTLKNIKTENIIFIDKDEDENGELKVE
jgi:flagellar biosynthesis/type III secretory pathway M-ring protein FliF/YscJ